MKLSLCGLAVCIASSVCAAGSVVHVSPSARGGGDGTAERPFASPQEALKFLRGNRPEGPVTVSFASGEYELSEPVVLRASDSGEPGAPVTWRGPADGSAKFVGARTLTRGATFAQWQALGNDVHGQCVDPLFVDAAKRDFRLRPESPAIAAGFRPFDISAAGLRQK